MRVIFKNIAIKIKYILIILMIGSYCNNAYSVESSGVLVVSEESDIKKISIIEVRKLFLGLPASKVSSIQHPVINNSDSEIYQSFLNKIMRMTEKSYKRKLIKRIFRQGAEKIQVVNSEKNLIRHLRNNPNDVTFMSEENVKNIKGIKVIQRLW
ncbi:MAG: hypothetical protein DIZ80_00800 [endosymbiont of Galathealinum brachiosum]|uniref:Uncharacterized protein n=1 Tax=endosymbiont of Galathealinum brachiosum TaxID=2200906 RepID=A0A370DMB2_9GAMM|nr:MAG: hypothetical protein DIZ80_00800 [endosymbiont of Galathealinum brachiosum]